MQQGVHLLAGPVPVLGGEGVEREIFHSETGGAFRDFAHRLHPGHMAFGPFKTAKLRPTAVAVHYYGYMDGQVRGIYLLYEFWIHCLVCL